MVPVQLVVHQDAQVLLYIPAFKTVSLQPVLIYVTPSLMHGFALLLVELHKIPVSPFLQPVEVPLNGDTTLWTPATPSTFVFLCISAEGAVCPIVQVCKKDVKW